jgi:flagellar basal-body rod modification protein FlgD
MAIAPVSSTAQTAQSAFGLNFQSLLQIILTQLTYQDPLKPMDNFEFVSQLAQFSQLQQSQALNDQITTLLSTQSTLQATSLLGRTVDLATGQDQTVTQSGTVTAVSLSSGTPQITIKTGAGQTVANLPLSQVVQVR